MSYTPRPDSYAGKIFEWSQQQPEGTTATASDIAAMFDCPANNVNVYLKPLRKAGLMTLEGRSYQLASEEEQAVEDDQSEYEFMAALDTDGQLFLRGIEPSGDGFVLTREQTVLLREYLLHTGSWIEAAPTPQAGVQETAEPASSKADRHD